MLTKTTRATVLEALENLRAGIFDVRTRYPKARHTDIIERIDAAISEVSAVDAAPQPDWGRAPTWAQWWAVDGSGATWFEYEPFADRAGYWTVGEDWGDMGQWLNAAADIKIPIGCDWRTLKFKRPVTEGRHNGT